MTCAGLKGRCFLELKSVLLEVGYIEKWPKFAYLESKVPHLKFRVIWDWVYCKWPNCGHICIRVNFQGAPQITQLRVISQMCVFEQCMSIFEQKLGGKLVKTIKKGAQRCQKQLLTHLGIFESLCMLSSGHHFWSSELRSAQSLKIVGKIFCKSARKKGMRHKKGMRPN